MIQQPEWMETMLAPTTFERFITTPAHEVKLIQTHISYVFLAGDRAFKVKKPVDFGFLDFSTLEKRREFSHAELRLNQRLCPDIYIEVVPLTSEHGKFELNGKGEVVEWVLVMRRMPEEGLMNRLLDQDLIGRKDIQEIVNRLVPFYASADSSEEVREMGSVQTITHNTEENFQQTEPFVGQVITEEAFNAICLYTRGFISENRKLIESRMEKGWIREGHGDLYSANICFDRKAHDVYIFDCIEFNQRFRCGDVASDVAFLAMDLDHFGLPQLSDHFIKNFSEHSHDPDLLLLNDFYKCYRAYVRGKIGCFTCQDQGVDKEVREESRRQAENYFKLALKYAGKAPTAHLYVFFGLSGSGKSTLAQAFAERHHLPVFNSDRIRKEIVAGVPATESHIEPFGAGIYSKEMSQRTYRAMSRLAGSRIVRGESAVLDATYTSQEERNKVIELAEAAGARIHFILCTCGEDTIKQRLSNRMDGEHSISDGRWEIYLRQKEHFADTSPLKSAGLIEVNTEIPVEQAVDMIKTDEYQQGN